MESVGLDAGAERARPDFGAYFAEYHREVCTLAYRLCGDRAVAEEVTADAFAEAWRVWDELTRDDAPPAEEAMREIVARLVEGRARGAARKPAAADGVVRADSGRIRALLAERITLIPPQDAPTVLIPRIADLAEEGSADEDSATRFRRPMVLSAVVGVGALAVIAVIALAASGGTSAKTSNQSPLSLAATGTIASAVPGSVTNSAVASGSASASASASPSRSPSPSPSPTRTASASASATTATSAAATAAAAAATTSASAPDALSVATGVTGGNSSWTELNVSTTVNQTLSALTITINVASAPGLRAASAWNSGAGGQFSETTTQNNDGSITYTFSLNSGQQVGSGSSISFAAQFSHNNRGWSASADTYAVSATVASSGATASYGGSF
ncbi:hypothetical protein KDK95_24400 [Actinospica sp. MGRD01-02]|uniref:RNA polymerase sigma-70 region 2 domain-containing protein n=1 Tax=Actinospica acidithermotolerans TaxID=2828514 RepID=A0A941IJH7_9ACTN|nr:sigma factor [Actinospica acidithermotolerans]MBR7829469.1 hypothetical protein [Actinospica acidithermotolerans]